MDYSGKISEHCLLQKPPFFFRFAASQMKKKKKIYMTRKTANVTVLAGEAFSTFFFLFLNHMEHIPVKISYAGEGRQTLSPGACFCSS